MVTTDLIHYYGILPVFKLANHTSFHLVSMLRKRTHIRTIGHTGTLDPFATGVMVMLIGKPYTRLTEKLIATDKEYLATLHLGKVTDTFDIEGTVLRASDFVPTHAQVEKALISFQGACQQIPPMYSAKKVNGQKLYALARQGITIERTQVTVHLSTELISYEYPYLTLKVSCSKGTYIRSLAYDLGEVLSCGAFLSSLVRTRVGSFTVSDCLPQSELFQADLTPFLKKQCSPAP